MLTFSWVPSTQTVDAAPRVLIGKIEEHGAEQRAEDGINPYDKRYTVTFRGPAADQVEAFLVGLGGPSTSFYWTPHGEVSQATFVCPSFAVPRMPGGEVVLTAVFERTYLVDTPWGAPYGIALPSNGAFGMAADFWPSQPQHPATVAWVLDVLRNA